MTSDKIQSKNDLIKKIIDFPVVAAFPYLISYFNTYLSRFFSGRKELRSWGPRFKGIDEAMRKYSLLDVCGMQWSRSVIATLESLSAKQEGKDYISVRYENL
jgi:hypothetical protein